MNQLPLRGIIAPGFIALAIAAGFLDLWLKSGSLAWLSLGFLVLGLVFARHTRRLVGGAIVPVQCADRAGNIAGGEAC